MEAQDSEKEYLNKMDNHDCHPLTHLMNSSKYSLKGVKGAFEHEEAFRQEIIIFAILCPLGWYLGNTPIEKILLIASWWLVIIVELVNSAIEAAIDRIGPQVHHLSGRAKDIGSAAVFFSILLSVFVWSTILLDRYL